MTYPRQKFFAVPYALKVPVNGSNIFSLPATPGAVNQVPKTNGSGVLSWANDETAGAGSVTSAAIANDTIADVDINSAAAIAGTKIAPNFGAQNIVTTGSVTAGLFSAPPAVVAHTVQSAFVSPQHSGIISRNY